MADVGDFDDVPCDCHPAGSIAAGTSAPTASDVGDFTDIPCECIPGPPTATILSPTAGASTTTVGLIFNVLAPKGFGTASASITDSVVTSAVAWTLAGGFASGYFGSSTAISDGYQVSLSRTGGWRLGALTLDIADADNVATTASDTRSWTMGASLPGTTTATYIRESSLHDPFYYLKITGLPYYFFSIIDPTDAKWGSKQWTLPTGYTSVKGMDVPSADFNQQLNDIIGGIATAERIRLSMMDFRVSDGNGNHSFFGRLMSPGRTAASSTATIGVLAADLHASADAASTLVARGAAGAFTARDTYVGGETIGVTSVTGPSGSKDYTLTIAARNKYPCHANYPPKPYYHVVYDESGNLIPDRSVLVSQGDPLTFIGRSAALYIGHMTPDGRPEPEDNALCRFIGHIRGVNYGRDPGKFEFDIESVVADIKDAMIAPSLAHAEINGGIYLPSLAWQRMTVSLSVTDTSTHAIASSSFNVTLTSNTYDTPRDVEADLQRQLSTHNQTTTVGAKTYKWTFTTGISTDGKFWIRANTVSASANLIGTATIGYPTAARSLSGGTTNYESAGLLTALGFDPANQFPQGRAVESDGTVNTYDGIVFNADRACPSVFFPTGIVGTGVEILLASNGDAVGDRYFLDQGDGSGIGWVRYGDGQVGGILAHGSGGSITVGARSTPSTGAFGFLSLGFSAATYYYVESPGKGTVDQVLHIPSKNTANAELALFQLLASKGYDNDGEFNVFPEGCGLGLDGILDKDSVRQAAFSFTTSYAFDVDATTKFSDLWGGISKLLGAFLVWDPTTASISLKQLQLTNAALASGFVLSESNRSSTGDRSLTQSDTSNLRTGWTIRYGWDYQQRKFTAPEINIRDNWAMQAYQVASRMETIEDRLLSPRATPEAIQRYTTSLEGARSVFTRYPWAKVTRSVNKTGLLLCPGIYCKIVDNTLFNPFTGLEGIVSTDDIYGFITSVSSNLSNGEVKVTFLIDQTNDASSLRPWSPVGLLDFYGTANGYDNATGVCTMTEWYAQGDFDGVSFVVGDKVALVPRSNGGPSSYEKLGTVTSVATNGATVTIDAGLGAVSTGVETIMILQDWASQTTARKTTSATRVTFQGDGVALLIAGSARLQKWT